MKKRNSIMFLLPLLLVSCSPSKVDFILPTFDEDVDIHTNIQNDRFINNKDVLKDTYLKYLDGLNYREDYSKPNPVTITFSATPDKGKINNYSIMISEKEDMSNPIIDSFSSTTYQFYNSKLGTTYHYQISADSFVSAKGVFTVKEGNLRLINIDGVSNVRDVAIKGKIKQGLVYRGGAFEKFDDEVVETKISPVGILRAQKLGIKTEVDLRRNQDHENCDLTSSKLPGAKYVSLPMMYGGKNILTYSGTDYDNPLQIKKFFELISDENNLPCYMHCSEGKDRTGCLSYLLQALLGAEEEDMLRDYVFSNFANTSYGMLPDGITLSYGKTLQSYKTTEETYSEVVYNYLNNVIGIDVDVLNNVIELFRA